MSEEFKNTKWMLRIFFLKSPGSSLLLFLAHKYWPQEALQTFISGVVVLTTASGRFSDCPNVSVSLLQAIRRVDIVWTLHFKKILISN